MSTAKQSSENAEIDDIHDPFNNFRSNVLSVRMRKLGRSLDFPAQSYADVLRISVQGGSSPMLLHAVVVMNK